MTVPLAPDLEIGRRFLAQHPPPGDIVFCAVSGAHLYGFASADSDLDLKGAHAQPTEALLGLSQPAEVHDVTDYLDGVECDVTTLEVRKALALLLGGNGNTLEQICSPLQLVETPALEALRDLARGALSKRFFKHYNGFFRAMQREHARPGEAPRAKTLLYSLRVALTGVHLLEAGDVEADVNRLAAIYGFADVIGALVEVKRGGAEKATVSPAQDQAGRELWPHLTARLQAAWRSTRLPDEPGNQAAADRWLTDFRLARLARPTR